MARGRKNGSRNNVVNSKGNYGSMNTDLSAAKVRRYILTSSVISTGRQFKTIVTNHPDLSLYPTGTHYDLSLSVGLGALYPNGLPQLYSRYDVFRIKAVEVFVAVDKRNSSSTLNPNLTIFSSVDLDDALPTNWQEFRRRGNIAMNTASSGRCLVRVGSFVPHGNYASSSTTSSPANAVPNTSTWFDTQAKEQQFVGLKMHLCTASDVPCALDVFAKVTIEWKAQC